MSKILSLQAFDAAVKSSRNDHPFRLLTPANLAFFRKELTFTKEGMFGGYWGDIVVTTGMNDAALATFVADFFGIDGGVFIKCLHHFGCVDGKCYPRAYYNCPYC